MFVLAISQMVAPVRFIETLRSRMPVPDEVAGLELPPGTPVIHLRRTAYAANDRAVEVNEMIMAADAYILEYEILAGSTDASAGNMLPQNA